MADPAPAAQPAAVLAGVVTDLEAESAGLEDLTRDLDPAGWRTPTPATGWTIADQVGHLAWTDEMATVAATDADVFAARLRQALEHFDGYVDRAAAEWAARDDLPEAWRAGRRRLADALAGAAPGAKLPWFGPPMSPTSMATARLMETWAHGQDVADALGVARAPTDRLRHVAHIGVRTRDFAYLVRDLAPPAEPFRIELTGPYGDVWSWGPDDAAQRVAGPALDFCLLVTRRRHRDDLAITAVGGDADRWLDVAQAFAGPPGPGREPQAQA